jgi:hypothetical protein
MKSGPAFTTLSGVLTIALSPALCFGQSSTTQGLPHFGVELNVGLLGAGIQAATAVTRKSNVRLGFNYFKYTGSTSQDNINYNGTLKLASAEILYDQYIVGGFHISPGVMIYNGTQANGTAAIPGGQTFTLNSVSYYSSMADPVTGTASVGFRQFAPELLLGFGNLLPRSARHFTLNFDLGVAFMGSASAKLNLVGSTCLNGPSAGCSPISSNPSVQNNILGEQNTVNNDLNPFKFYPVIRMGFGYKF